MCDVCEVILGLKNGGREVNDHGLTDLYKNINSQRIVIYTYEYGVAERKQKSKPEVI